MSNNYKVWVGSRRPDTHAEPDGSYAVEPVDAFITALDKHDGQHTELVARSVLSVYCGYTVARYQRNPGDYYSVDFEVERSDPNEIYIRTQGTSVLIKVPHTQGPW